MTHRAMNSCVLFHRVETITKPHSHHQAEHVARTRIMCFGRERALVYVHFGVESMSMRGDASRWDYNSVLSRNTTIVEIECELWSGS